MIPSLPTFTGTHTIHGIGASAFMPVIPTGVSVLAGGMIPTGIPSAIGHTIGPGMIPGTEITGMVTVTDITTDFMMGTMVIILLITIMEHPMLTEAMFRTGEYTTGTVTGVAQVVQQAGSAMDIQPPPTGQLPAEVTMSQRLVAGPFLTVAI